MLTSQPHIHPPITTQFCITLALPVAFRRVASQQQQKYAENFPISHLDKYFALLFLARKVRRTVRDANIILLALSHYNLLSLAITILFSIEESQISPHIVSYFCLIFNIQSVLLFHYTQEPVELRCQLSIIRHSSHHHRWSDEQI